MKKSRLASEIAAAGKYKTNKSNLIKPLFELILLGACAANVVAAPQGGEVVGGAGSISHSGSTTQIDQLTDRMAIDWQSYDLAADELVKYVQPDSSSISLNRILSNHGSQIQGQIDANGHVFLINPNGVIFGENATLNVGGILASGLDIDPYDFMNGDFAFSALDGAEGKVINAGIINAATGGSVSLIGKEVRNDGLIVANLGAVNLATGKEAVVTFDAEGLVGVRVTKEVLQSEIGLDAALVNSGEIRAESGQILITGSVSEDIFSQAVQIGDQARSVVVHDDGSFTLGAGADVVNTGTVSVSGGDSSSAGRVVILGNNIDVSGNVLANGQSGEIEVHASDTVILDSGALVSASSEQFDAGQIKLLGNKVGLLGGASVLAESQLDGGEIFIGGDITGGNIYIPNSDFVYVGENAHVSTSSQLNGDGGKIITFANENLQVYGTLEATGGIQAGDGGFIETSGLRGFDIQSVPNSGALSISGEAGEWLIDPVNITIDSSGSGTLMGGLFQPASNTNSSISVSVISTGLLTSDVTIRTDGDDPELTENGNITLNSDLKLADGYSTRRTLTLRADGDVILSNGSIYGDRLYNNDVNTAGLNIVIVAADNYTQSNGKDIMSGGGNISITAQNITLSGPGGESDATSIFTDTGNVINGDVTLTATSGSISIGAGGNNARINAGNGDISTRSNTFIIGDGTKDEDIYLSANGVEIQAGNQVTISDDIVSSGGNVSITGIKTGLDITDPLETLIFNYDSGSTPADAVIKTSGAGGSVAGSITLNASSIQLQNDTLFDAQASADGSFSIAGIVNGFNNDLTVWGGEGDIDSISNVDDLNISASGILALGGDISVADVLNLQASGISGSGANLTSVDGGDNAVTLSSTDGDISIGDIIAYWGYVDIQTNIDASALSGDLSVGDVFLSNGSDVNESAGSLTVNSVGATVLGEVYANASSLTGNGTGRNGGTINISASSIDVSAIYVRGGNASVTVTGVGAYTGGAGGTIDLVSTSGEIVVGDVDLGGGAGAIKGTATDANGGAAGSLTLNSNLDDSTPATPQSNIVLNGNIMARPAAAIGSGSDGAVGSVILNGSAYVLGESVEINTSVDGGSGAASDVTFLGAVSSEAGESNSLTITANNISFLGQVGDSDSTRLGDLSLTAAGYIDATSQDIVAASLIANANGGLFISKDIETSGTADTTGGDVQITATSTVTTGAIKTTAGTLTTDGDGLTAGAITLEGTSVTTGSLTADGGSVLDPAGSGGYDGGAGGTITITARDSLAAYSITVAGEISATGGAGDTTGSDGGVGTALIQLEDDTQQASVYLGTNSAGNEGITNYFDADITVIGTTRDDDVFYGPSLTSGELHWVINDTATTTSTIGATLASPNVELQSFQTVVGRGATSHYHVSGAGSVTSIEGETGSNLIYGPDAESHWSIDQNGDGTLKDGADSNIVAFSGMDVLTGGDDQDIFNIDTRYDFQGIIDGGAGSSDQLFLTDTTNTRTVQVLADNLSTIPTNTFIKVANLELIDNQNGNSANTLTVVSGEHNWAIKSVLDASAVSTEGTDDGEITGADLAIAVRFIDFAQLVGSDGIDAFTINDTGMATGSITGGATANNTLSVANASGSTYDWLITDAQSGSVDFDGAGTLTFSQIQTVTASSGDQSLQSRAAQDNDWSVNGASSYVQSAISSADRLNFSGFSELQGNDGKDNFDVQTFSAITIDGGDSVNADTLTIASAASVSDNYWGLSASETGTVNAGTASGTPAISFSEIEVIDAPDDRADNFVLSFFSDPLMTILAGSGTGDQLTYNNGTTAVQVTLSAGGASNTGVQGIESISLANPVAGSTLTVNYSGAVDWDIDTGAERVTLDAGGADPATTSFSNFTHLVGGSGSDNFDISSATTLTQISGGEGADTFNVLTSGLALTLVGGENTDDTNVIDRLNGPAADSYWQISGTESGALSAGSVAPGAGDPVIDFTQIESVVGSDSVNDTFAFTTLSSGIALEGGAGGTDVADYTGAGTVTVNLETGLNVVSGVEEMQAGSGSTLVGPNSAQTWDITGVNDGTVAGISFEGFANLTGGSAADRFDLAYNVTGLISGGEGADTFNINASGLNLSIAGGEDAGTDSSTDTLNGFAQDNYWAITGSEAGELSLADYTDPANPVSSTPVIQFTQLESAAGTDANRDYFVISALSYGMTLEAGAADPDGVVDTADYSNVFVDGTSLLEVVLGTGVNNIESVVGGDDANAEFRTLTGTTTTETWQITGSNQGTVGGITFSGFGNIKGGGGTDTLTGPNADTWWVLTGANAGFVSSAAPTASADTGDLIGTFQGITDLAGGSADDVFIVRDGGSIGGATGGDQSTQDSISYAQSTADTSVTLSAGTGTGSFSEIEKYVGNNTGTASDPTSTLSIASGISGDVTWQISSINDGSVSYTYNSGSGDVTPTITFENFSELNGGANTNDSFQLMLDGARVTGEIDGGSASGNSITGPNAVTDWVVTAAENYIANGDRSVRRVQSFSNIQTLNGGSSQNQFDIEQGEFSGTINGGTGALDELIINNSSGLVDWQITAIDQGTVDGSAITFTAMENLTGAAGNDRFTLTTAASRITGTVDGGGGPGVDRIVAPVEDTDWVVTSTARYVGVTGSVEKRVNSFAEIEELYGSTAVDTFSLAQGQFTGTVNGSGGNDELQITNSTGDVDWQINGVNDGVVDGNVTFIDMPNLTGAGGNDKFTLSGSTAQVTGTIQGGSSGTDELIGADAASEWYLGASDIYVLVDGSSTRRVQSAQGIETVTGGTAVDEFFIEDAGFSLTINGGEHPTADSTTVDSLYGQDAASYWQITGDEQGKYSWGSTAPAAAAPVITFSQIESAVGSDSAADYFSIQTLASNMSLDAGDPADSSVVTDVADYSSLASATVYLTGTNLVTDAERLIGNGAGFELVGTNSGDTWTTTAVNSGTVAGYQFENFATLTGGTSGDTFELGHNITGAVNGGNGGDQFEITAAISGALNGGNGSDRFEVGASVAGGLNGDNGADTFDIQSAAAIATIAGGADSATDILELNHGAATTWLMSDAVNNTAGNITFSEIETARGSSAIDTVTINNASVTRFEGRGESDTLTVNDWGVDIVGGTEGTDVNGDVLTLGINTASTWSLTGSGSSVAPTGGGTPITFSGIETIEGNGQSDIFNIAAANVLQILGLGGADEFHIQNSSVENIKLFGGTGTNSLSVDHSAPSSWLISSTDNTLNSGTAGDITFVAMNTLNGGSGADTFTINTAFTGNINGRESGDTFYVNSAVTGTLHGNEDNDVFNLSASVSDGNAAVKDVFGDSGNDTFNLNSGSVVTQISGGDNTDTLNGFAEASEWSITTLAGDSTIQTSSTGTPGSVTFAYVETLVGQNNVADSFVLAAGSSTAGMTISAGGGTATDTVDLSNTTSATPINISGGTGFSGVSGAERIKDDGDLVLEASAGAVWNIYDFSDDDPEIDGVNDGVVETGSGNVEFINFASLLGGTGVDSFEFEGGTITGNITGVGEGDSISRTTEGTSWVISGTNQGSFDDLGGVFSGIDVLQGNAGADQFLFEAAGSWTGTGAQIIGGDGTGTDSIVSQHGASTWNVTADAAGNVTGWLGDFSGIELLNGSSAADTFLVSAYMETILGGVSATEADRDTLQVTVSDPVVRWEITADNEGSVQSGTASALTELINRFSGIENLTGGDSDDTFAVIGVASIDGDFVGGNGYDVLDLSQFTGVSWTVIGGNYPTPGGTTFNVDSTVEDQIGSSSSLTQGLVGPEGDVVWEIIGPNTVRINDITYPNIGQIIGRDVSNDTFNFSVDGTFNGQIDAGNGAGTNDVINAADLSTESIWVVSDSGSGTVDFNSVITTFLGIEDLNAGAGADSFTVEAADASITSIAANIHGGNGSNTFVVNTELAGTLTGGSGIDDLLLNAPVTGAINTGGADDIVTVATSILDMSLDAGESSADNDTLIIDYSAAATWAINSGNWTVTDEDGTANVITIANFETLNGSEAADTVTFNDAAFTGTFNGRDGVDDFTLARDDLSFTLNGQDGTSVDASVDSLTNAHDTDTSWTLTAATGSVTTASGSVTVSGIDSITGGDGIDTVVTTTDMQQISTGGNDDSITLGGNVAAGVFAENGNDTIVIASDAISATVDGGSRAGDTDSLQGPNSSGENNWEINAGGAGTLTTASIITFDNMESYTGGSGVDHFDVNAEVAGQIQGGGSADTFLLAANVNGGVYGNDGADSFTLEQAGLAMGLFGGAAVDSMVSLASTGTSNDWTLTADNTGTVTNGGTVTFDSVENLTGSDLVDNFEIGYNLGSANGGGGDDSFELTASGISLTVNGGADSDTITSSHSDGATWTLTATEESIIDKSATPGTVTVSGLERLIGGDGDDSFVIQNGLERIESGAGNDDLTIGALISAGIATGDGDDSVQLTVADLGMTVDGGNDNDTLSGPNADTTWRLTSDNGGSYVNSGAQTLVFSSMENLSGGSGNDHFEISAGVAIDGVISGGNEVASIADPANPNYLTDVLGDSIDATALTGAHTFTQESSRSAGTDVSFVGIELIEVTEETGSGVYDTIESGTGSNVWVIDGDNTGTLTEVASGNTTRFVGFQNIQGGVGVDTFTLAGSGSDYIDGVIDGGEGATAGEDPFDSIDYSLVERDLSIDIADSASGSTGISNIEGVTGYREGTVGANYQRVINGVNGPGTWTISDFDGDTLAADGVNDGVYSTGGQDYRFINFDTLVGSDGNDTFVLSGTGAVTGGIIGGGGLNTLTATGATTPLVVELVNSPDLANMISGDNILQIHGVSDITGNGALQNTLMGYQNLANAWTITGGNDGMINGIDFTDFAYLVGGDLADVFSFTGAGAVSGSIDGAGGASDTVDITALADGVTVGVDAVASADIDLGIANIETLAADGNNNQLVGAALDSVWTVTGTNQGTLAPAAGATTENTLDFAGFEHLTGNSADDRFVLDGSDRVTGIVRGGGGFDSLDLTSLTDTANNDTRVSVVNADVTAATAAADLTVNGFEEILGSATTENYLMGANAANAWVVDGTDTGTLNTSTRFTDFGHLIGGNNDDVFAFTALGEVSGSIDGGDQIAFDTVDLSELSVVNVNLGDGANQVVNIERIRGNNFNSTLTAADQVNAWVLTAGVNDGSINNQIVFEDFNYLVGGDARDVFTVNGGSVTGSIDAGGGNDAINVTLLDGSNGGINLDGNLGDNDSLTLSSAASGFNVAYSPDISGSGQLVYTGGADTNYTVRYLGTEVITDNIAANTMTLNGSSAAENIVLGNNRVTVGDYATVNFNNKENLVVAAASDDVILIDSNVNAPGTIELRNGAVVANSDDARIDANSLVLNATGAVGSAGALLETDINNVSIQSATGDIFLYNLNPLNIAQLDSGHGVNLVAEGAVSSSTALSSQGALTIEARNGNIDLNNAQNTLEGPLTLVARNNSVQVRNGASTELAGVQTQTLNITSTGNIMDSGNVSVGGLATLSASGDIVLDSAGNDFNQVNVAGGQNVTLVDSSALEISNFDATGSLDVLATGITLNSQISVASANLEAGNGAVAINDSLTASGDVLVAGRGINVGASLSASNLSIADTTGGITLNGNLQAGNELLVTSQSGAITQQADIAAGNVQLTTGGTVTMATGVNTTSTDGTIAYTAGGQLQVSNISAGAGNILLVSTGGQVVDITEGFTVAASHVDIQADEGINGTGSSGSEFLVAADTLSLTNQTGTVSVRDENQLTVDRLRNNGDVRLVVQSGNLVLDNRNDNTYDHDQGDAVLAGGVSSANYNIGTLTLQATTGDIIAMGPIDQRQPDVVARNAFMIAQTGDVGTPGRPLVYHVQDSLLIQSARNYTPFWTIAEPQDYRSEGLNVDPSDLLNLGAEQLIEVEEIDEVDPAIFTAVNNYFFDDVSIRLPNDQLYDDELEEYAAAE